MTPNVMKILGFLKKWRTKTDEEKQLTACVLIENIKPETIVDLLNEIDKMVQKTGF